MVQVSPLLAAAPLSWRVKSMCGSAEGDAGAVGRYGGPDLIPQWGIKSSWPALWKLTSALLSSRTELAS